MRSRDNPAVTERPAGDRDRRIGVKATAPVPMLRLLVPVKVKLDAQVWALLFERVIAPPEVLSMVPPLMVNVPVPMAVALLMFSVPAAVSFRR